MTQKSIHHLSVICVLVVIGCASAEQDRAGTLFVRMGPEKTGINFSNTLSYAYEFNIYRYRNFYNGGGVAIGDVNNDGWKDIYFVGNQSPNRLYLNNGDFTFTDVSEDAGVTGRRAWSTGVSMADINGDGWLDIYVCNSGIVEGDDKKNELFINNTDGTFTERAEDYGIADAGLSIHGSFFDYDRDGDLDLYLVNNSYRNIGSFNLRDNTRHVRHVAGGDRLYRNELVRTVGPNVSAKPRFKDVSAEAGIYGSEIGFGLGVSVGDVNRDGWSDMYISNDFFERDYLYVNRGDGTFAEVLEDGTLSVSAAAMGADMADLNADGYPEIFVTDMLPSDELRLKTVTSFDTWERYQNYISDDYYHQFTRNTLQLNRGHVPVRNASADRPQFSEVGRLAGVEASDWSWGAMIADYDLDGRRDLFVANGIYQDLTNADYLVKIRDEETMDRLIDGNTVNFRELIDMIPSNPIPNHMFKGGPDLAFTNVTESWGLAHPGFSNGSAYGDLDNDGDLDLVVNNVNMEPFVYRNRARELAPEQAWLQVDLEGTPANRFGVGAQVTAWSAGRQWYTEQQPVRGFQSTVDHTLHLAFGSMLRGERLDSLTVLWPDSKRTTLQEVDVNRKITVRPGDGSPFIRASLGRRADPDAPLLDRTDPVGMGLAFRHQENTYSDFDRQPMLFHMRSTEGPPLCTGDVDGDGLEDVYVGGAKDQAGILFTQTRDGFTAANQPALENDRTSEDTGCIFFDADGDGAVDLFVASGGSEFPASSSALIDRLYLNENGALVRSDQVLTFSTAGFEPTGAAAAGDYDGDGDLDLFVGTRMRPFAFGLPADGHLLENDGTGHFTEVTDERAAELRQIGMITDAQWADVDGDGDTDLMVTGEWMPLMLFENRNGSLVDATSEAGLDSTAGWWNDIHIADLDDDGDLDLIGANHGRNSRFRTSHDEPIQLWVDDFDGNGSVEQVLAMYRDGKAYPMALRHDLIAQLPALEQKYPTYESYAGQTVYDVFDQEQLEGAVHHHVELLESVVGWNEGGRFHTEPLPLEAQLAPMYAAAAEDLDGDGRPEVILGGNLYEAKPEVGRYDASYGAVFVVEDGRMHTVAPAESGFFLKGPIRALQTVDAGRHGRLIVARNNDSLAVYTYGE